MSLLDALQALSGGGQSSTPQGGHVAVSQALLQEADQHPGGLAGMLDGFRQNGMDQHVNSWMGPQQNQSITPDQVQQGMGSDLVTRIAERAGISPGIAKSALAVALPIVVSHLSQGGQQQLPSQGGLTSIASSLLSRAL